MNSCTVQGSLGPGYFDLKRLAVYSSCSVRWLRDRLYDPTAPLPFHRVGGKILVLKEDFDAWMLSFRTIEKHTAVSTIVDDVLADLLTKRAS